MSNELPLKWIKASSKSPKSDGIVPFKSLLDKSKISIIPGRYLTIVRKLGEDLNLYSSTALTFQSSQF
jgi:hypothetical protein